MKRTATHRIIDNKTGAVVGQGTLHRCHTRADKLDLKYGAIRYRVESIPGTCKPARRTNTNVVHTLMEYSDNGALMQAFVLTAIEKYAAQCIKAGAAVFDNPMMNGQAWINCATEARATVDAHLGEQS